MIILRNLILKTQENTIFVKHHESLMLTNRLIEARWFRMRETPPKIRVNQISSHVAV